LNIIHFIFVKIQYSLVNDCHHKHWHVKYLAQKQAWKSRKRHQ